MGLLAVPHLAQLVQLDVGLQFPKTNLRLWSKGDRLKQAQGRVQGGEEVGKEEEEEDGKRGYSPS